MRVVYARVHTLQDMQAFLATWRAYSIPQAYGPWCWPQWEIRPQASGALEVRVWLRD